MRQRKKVCLIVNPNAGTAEQFASLEHLLEAREDVTVWESTEAGDGRRLGVRATEEGFDLVAAAGGDGTISEVADGLLSAGLPRDRTPILGLIPLGTGNDLARMLCVPEDPRDAFALLRAGVVEPLDVIAVEAEGERRFGLNACAGGFSGQVDEALTPELKSGWGPLAYLIGAASVLPDLCDYRTVIQCDDQPEEAISAFNIIVANGRTAAGGKRVSPLSNPQDGLLDLVIVRFASVVELTQVAARLMASNYLDSPLVEHREVQKVAIHAEPGMWFNVDGELFSNAPATFEVLPARLDVVVGTDYRAEPPS